MTTKTVTVRTIPSVSTNAGRLMQITLPKPPWEKT